jgi:hypothetical protein
MHGFRVLTIFLIVFVSSHDGVCVNAGVKNDAPFNPSGDYHPVNTPARGPERFAHFDLEVRRRKGRLIARGDVRTVGARYEFASVSVTEKRLTFRTVSLRGVSYGFDGRFLGGGDFPSQFTGYGLVMLEGTLTRYQGGRKAAEINSTFMYYPGC